MKFAALALDYDGTIARDGALDPGVRAAIADVRERGVTVLLVTGRILDELKRVAGDLHFVDVVVAENGAVLEFPDSGYATTLGPPPPAALLDALRAANVGVTPGRVILDADARDAARLLEVVRGLELPYVLAFNRGRVMVLPQAISKATGLRHALTILRLSSHNTVAIGDAENDHELLRSAELGVAVGWGSPALKAAADVVLPGDGPQAVAPYLRTLAAAPQIPAPRRPRRQLLVGYQEDGQPLALGVHGRNVLVAGDPKSGKSWVTGLLCEQLILHGYCLCILDPEGDYTSLQALPGVTVLGGADPLPRPRDLLRALRHPDGSVVVDLSRTPYDEKMEYTRTLLPGLAALRRHTGLPHRIIVDEAHYFLQTPDVLSMMDFQLNGYTLVTYRASKLHPAVLMSNEAVLVTRESHPAEVRALLDLCRDCSGGASQEHWERVLGSLVVGEAAVLPVTWEAGGTIRRIRLAPRLTPHVRHQAKYIDMPIAPSRAFVFWRGGVPTGQRARTLREFVAVIESAPPGGLDGHMRRGDFSRWAADVFGDYPLAVELRRLEARYAAGTLPDIAAAVGQAVRARYDFVYGLPDDPAITTRPSK